MRRVRIAVAGLFVLSALLLALSTGWNLLTTDRTLPTIQCPETPLYLSVYDGEEKILAGVTASDEKDGDLTDQIFIQGIGTSVQGSSTTVTYAVVDSANHVATATRELHYTDYNAPRFSLSQALRYTVGSPVTIRDRLQAQDSVDGDLSAQIRILSGGLSTNLAGIYPVTFEVTNSLGNTASVTLDVVIESQTAAETPRIYLNQYLIYTAEGEEFDGMNYLDSVAGGSKSNVSVQMPAGGLVPGVNAVTFYCTGSNGAVGTTTLYVVVE